MLYLDTNILVYSLINQDYDKMMTSQAIINQCITDSSLLISPLSLQELVFTLAKLKIDQITLNDSIATFKTFSRNEIDTELFSRAFELASASSTLLNINDAIHLAFAERYATKLLTFDRDFKKLTAHTSMPIEILS